VGEEGQEKWRSSRFLLAGEGEAVESARSALSSSGASDIRPVPPDLSGLADCGLLLVLTEDADLRRRLNRAARKAGARTLLGWASGSGFALCASGPSPSKDAPCFECFETLNPKAFSIGNPESLRILGALAASEALLWVLEGRSPLEGKVWLTSLASGLSFAHEITPSPKCPALLAEKGITLTP
jgi:hypothetical protein